MMTVPARTAPRGPSASASSSPGILSLSLAAILLLLVGAEASSGLSAQRPPGFAAPPRYLLRPGRAPGGLCALNSGEGQEKEDRNGQDGTEADGEGGFVGQHKDKRGVTGRFSTFAEGLDADEMTQQDFREALRERMMERRRTSKGGMESTNYLEALQKKPTEQ